MAEEQRLDESQLLVKDWAHLVLRRAEPWLGRPTSPLAVKEMAWRLIHRGIRCGTSNPLSFAIRPVVMSGKLRTAVGIYLAILAVVVAVLVPMPTMAENTGGQIGILTGEPAISLATPAGVQVPIKNFTISQGFWALHPGIDMTSEIGVPIHPIMAGVVIKAEENWFGYGNMVIVKHSDEYESLYAHMSKIMVSEGQEVSVDTVLGLVGITGRSTGPHLHLEIHENGKPVNPATILDLVIKQTV